MHKHHIMPRHLGGSNESDNLIRVSVEEHAKIHHSQWILGGRQEDYIAWKSLSGQIDKYEINRLRAMLPKSDKHKKNLSLAWKNRKPFTKETREKMRLAHMGKPSGSSGKTWKCVPGRHKAWNKGLTKDDPRVAMNIAKMAATRYGWEV